MIKKILIAATILLVACERERKDFTGYVVGKEFVKHHMSDEATDAAVECTVIVPPMGVHKKPEPVFMPTLWILYVANKSGVIAHKTDSINYMVYSCGSRITVKH